MTPSPLAVALGHLMSRRGGRVVFIACSSALVGGLAYGSASFLGAGEGGRLFFTAGMTLLAGGYFIIFVNLALLGYFPRRTERAYERLIGPAAVLMFVAMSLTAAPSVFEAVAVTVVGCGMALFSVLNGARDLRAPLRTTIAHPRSAADAKVMLALARSMPGGLALRERFNVDLNTVHALVSLAESDDTYTRLHEAYDILVALTASTAYADPRLRTSVAQALTDVAGALHLLGDDRRIHEQAALALDQALAHDAAAVNRAFRRLLNLADLELVRAGLFTLPTRDGVAQTPLRRSIAHLHAALPLSPRDRRHQLHHRLAICHAALADLTEDPGDLRTAITETRSALQALRPANREERPAASLILADLLVRQAAATGDPTGLAEARELTARSRTIRDPEVHALGWIVHTGAVRLQRSLDPHSVDAAAELARISAGVTAVPPYSRSRLRLAAALADWAATENDARTAAWAYTEALATARRLSATGLIRRQQQAALYEVRGLAAEAAHWLHVCGRPHDAVVVLESSRALVLSSAVDRDLLIRRLERHDPALAARCAQLSVRLAAVDRGGPEWGPAQLWAGLNDRHVARAVHEEWRALTRWLARWPEFRSLLAEPGYAAIEQAAQHGPLVYLAAARRRGFALVVERGAAAPRLVDLPDLTREVAADLAYTLREESRSLGTPDGDDGVWRDSLTAVLDTLRAALAPLAEELPASAAATLLPMGDLALLPLHAAAPDRVTWRYTPTAHVLTRSAEAAHRAARQPARLLLVSAPGPTGRRLRHTTAVAPALARHAIDLTTLDGDAARRDSVQAAVAAHNVYHFACHGAADPVDPLNSCLELSDGPLTMRELLDRRLPARLAVLAACETGVPYAQLPDEAVSLPAALLEAGVPGVIGTLWPVQELPTLLITLRFYELWLGGRTEPAAALRQSQSWLRTATAAELRDYLARSTDGSVRLPQLLIGRAAQARIYDHPDYWAAFTYTGI